MSPEGTRDNFRLWETKTRSMPKRIEAARYLLRSLYEEGQYPQEMKIVYCWVCTNAIEDFLYDEIFNKATVIQTRLDWKEMEDGTPVEASGNEEEEIRGEKDLLKKLRKWIFWKHDRGLICQLLALYFLNCRHNLRLDRCLRSSYQGEMLDQFLGDCLLWEAGENCRDNFDSMMASFWRIFCPKLSEEEARGHFLEILFGLFQKTLFCFEDEEEGKRYSWSALGETSLTVTIRVTDFQDDLYDGQEGYRYPDYVAYLCSEKRNGLVQVDSLKPFWNETVGKSRANTILLLYPSDLDLERFCLMLGLDEKVFERLCRLRDLYFPPEKHLSSNRVPTKDTRRKQKMLHLFMQQVYHRVQEARFLCRGKPEEIPRQMLVSASVQLIQKGVTGICLVEKKDLSCYTLPPALVKKILS